MHRFYVEAAVSSPFTLSDIVSLPEHISHQIKNVLRMRLDEYVVLFTGDGGEWTAKILPSDRREQNVPSVCVRLLEHRIPAVEMRTSIIMVMALTRSQRYELALAKCTELGASEFRPIVSDRVLKSDVQIGSNRMARWKRILTEASELSGRVSVPNINAPAHMSDTISALSGEGIKTVMLWEQAEGPMLADLVLSLRDQQQEMSKLALILGPVGGFDVAEVHRAEKHGTLLASLGSRILRTETAAITSMSVVSQLLK